MWNNDGTHGMLEIDGILPVLMIQRLGDADQRAYSILEATEGRRDVVVRLKGRLESILRRELPVRM